MHPQHRHAGLCGLGAESGLAQQGHLDARSAEALQPVAAAGDDQQPARIGGTETGHVDRQFLAVAAQQRVAVGVHVQPRGHSRRRELGARFGVALREGVDHAGRSHVTCSTAPCGTSLA